MGVGKFKQSNSNTIVTKNKESNRLKTQFQTLIDLVGNKEIQPIKAQTTLSSLSTTLTKPYLIQTDHQANDKLIDYIISSEEDKGILNENESNDIKVDNKAKNKNQNHNVEAEKLSLFIYLTTIFSYSLLFLFGLLRDIYGRWIHPEEYKFYSHHNGYAPIVEGFERLFHRYVYTRIKDVFARPFTGVPGRTIKVLERYSNDYNMTYEYTGQTIELMNLASYNYLGFSESSGYCNDKVVESIQHLGVTMNSSPLEVGYSTLLRETESLVAKFVGSEDALIISQGYSTNASILPAIVNKGCLILSDELNHASLVAGARLSGATIRTFKHNDIDDLTRVLRYSISKGQPRTYKPWRKILVVVEGLYSMEGTMPNLTKIVELKKRYKFYIYLDEAHSIGALGPRGRGICDLMNVNPKDIDILMGTFTKSFGAAGGYIASTKEVIQTLRVTNHCSIYGETMSVPVLQQTYSSILEILGESDSPYPDDGKRRLQALAFNSIYFYQKLKQLGFTLTGTLGSPVVPVMIYHSSKIAAFSRECLKAGIAVVVVGYPATPVMRDRVRFCLSAAHTKDDLDAAIKIINEIGERIQVKNLN